MVLAFAVNMIQKSFQNEIKTRQAQAKKSLFIETPRDSNSINLLIKYCTQIALTQNIFRTDVDLKSYLLVEFNNQDIANEMIQNAYHTGNPMIDGKIRTKSRFLTFNPTKVTINATANLKSIKYNYETNIANRDEILRLMRNETTSDKQIMKLYNLNKLSDLSSRLRFLTALQIEEAISGLFQEPQVLPFGSSINGFGRIESDLDMVLMSNGNRKRVSPLNAMELGKSGDMSRHTLRNNLHVMSNIARNWLHGVKNVVPVLHARVPIIKYTNTFTNLECDLSMNN